MMQFGFGNSSGVTSMDAVVNVHVDITHRTEDIMEVVATGTAVKRTGANSSIEIDVQ